jgi:hypothetical protein
LAMDQPTMSREKASITAAQYTVPSAVGCLGGWVADRAAAASAPVEALDAGGAHQPGDSLEVHHQPEPQRQLGVDPR